MNKEEMNDFFEENVNLVIPNWLWRTILLILSDFEDTLKTEGFKGSIIQEMIMPVFEDEKEKTEWLAKMFQTNLLAAYRGKSRNRNI